MLVNATTDAWLAARWLGIVINVGPSGSRLQIYSWKDPQSVLEEHGDAVRNILPRVVKGVQFGEDWVKKVEPGALHTSSLSSLFRPMADSGGGPYI